MSEAYRFSASQAEQWQRRPSPLARYGFLVYTVLVIVASLFPFVGWRDMGIPAFAYLSAEWPYRGLRFDIVVNILGYLPLGLLTSFASYPYLRRVWAVVPSTLYCTGLSCVLEGLQTWLPTRVPSKVDLLTNVIGGLLGALLAIVLEKPILMRGWLRELRVRWFETDASLGLVLLVLWFGALAYPEPFALGTGGFIKPVLDMLFSDLDLFSFDPWSTFDYILAEAVMCALALVGAGCLLLNLTRPSAPRRRLIIVFILLTLLMKTLAQGLAYVDESSLVWLTDGALWGLAAGSVLLLLLSGVSRRLCAHLGFWALLLAVGLNNLVPENPYYDPLAHAWAYGRFLNFYGLTIGLSYVWPLVVLIYLMRHRKASQAF